MIPQRTGKRINRIENLPYILLGFRIYFCLLILKNFAGVERLEICSPCHDPFTNTNLEPMVKNRKW